MNTPRLQTLRILSLALLCVIGTAQAGQGLLGEYFNVQTFRNENGSAPVQRVDFTFQDTDIQDAEFPPGFTADTGDPVIRNTITVQWTGDIQIDEPGLYTFRMRSDDGSRLWIGGELLLGDPAPIPASGTINSWRDQGVTQVYTNTKTLAAGRYAIRIELQQGNGGVGVDLAWTKPNGTAELIPNDRFTPAPATAASGGVLVVTQAATPANVNLTTDGTLDWVHFGAGNDRFAINRKSPVTVPAFANKIGLNTGGGGDGLAGFGANTSTPVYAWANGTPLANSTSNAGIHQDRDVAGHGIVFCVPADTVPKRIVVYCGAEANSSIRVEAKLSDFSAPAFRATNVNANAPVVFDMRYQATRPNQMLCVRITSEGTSQARLHAVSANLTAPQTTSATYTLNEDTPTTFTLGIVDQDGGPTPNQVSITVPTANGTLTGPLNGTITYTPNPNFNGTDRFTFIVTDGIFISAGSTVTFNVLPVNDGPPVLVNDTATTPDNVPVTTAVLANDTVLDTPFTVSLVGQPANGTAVLNPDNTITYRGRLSFLGTDVVTYRVTDGDGESSTATLTITVTAIPPVITSPLSVNAIQGLLFTYKITATGTLPMTFTAAPLPAGVTLVGDTLQGFIQAGSYAVTISATNLAASDIRTLIINAIVQSPNTDTDGDGFTDEFEIGVGSSPVDPNSTPFTVLRNGAGGIPGGIPTPGTVANPKPFFVSSFSIKLDFKSTKLSRDAITLKGTLPVPSSFSSSLQAVAVNVGGVTVSGVLDSRGSYTSANKLVKIKVGKTKTSLSGANAPISVSAKGVYAGALTDEGYSNTNATKVFGKVILFVAASNEYFSATVTTEYNARTGQKGSVKPAKR